MRLLLPLFIVLLASPLAAQSVQPSLDRDPVFTALLTKQISYPIAGERAGVYAKIYAGFRINAQGHVQDVEIINPVKTGYGFDDEVLRALKRLPPLQPRYQGDYVLPVTFAMLNANRTTVVVPAGNLSALYFSGRILLSAIKVVSGKAVPKGNVVPYTRGEVLTIDR